MANGPTTRRTRLFVLLCATFACGSPRFAPQGPTVSNIAEPPAPAERTDGPLSLTGREPGTSWAESQEFLTRARSIYLDRTALHEDGQRFLALVDELFPAPSTRERAIGVQAAHLQMGQLEQLAPYPFDAVCNSFNSNYRLPLCTRAPGQMSHCWPDLVVMPPMGGPFELTEPVAGIARLVIRDLSNASDPAWTSFPTERIARARGVVLDLRDAAGTDPRPLLALLERLTGRAPFRPLRAIRRPADLDPYVADYAHRFVAESRDRAVWAGLVGTMPPANASPPPIAVIVGPRCGAACELAARALVTYADAALFGAVGPSGRLERDEPARLVLPHSKIEIYFNATEYLLDEAIERKTGPSAEWWQRVTENYSGDLATFAVHEIEQRLAGKVQPRCDSKPGYTSLEQLPPEVRAKLPTAGLHGSHCQREITLTSAAPLSAVRRYAETCTPPIAVTSLYGVLGQPFRLPNDLQLPELSRLAQSDLVERIDVDCVPEPQLVQPN